MEDSTSQCQSQSLSPTSSPRQDHSTSSDHVNSDAAVYSASGSNGAKYKLMSPAKLPISRSPCFPTTIPPALSPTSFLESPVLLSNIKAEPSPTTGSFSKPQFMHHGSSSTAVFSLTASCLRSNILEETKSAFFEFKPYTGSNSVSGISSAEPPISTGFNHWQSEPFKQLQDKCQSQSFASSPLVKCEMAVSSKELSLSGSGVSVRAGVDSDELKQRGNPNTGVQASQSDHKDIGPSVTAERSSDDGYNWRKYGQKLVKGSEFPRSYYKCTHPNCEVKKIFERSHDGKITEIVYKGTHDHPKPQPSRRFTSGGLISIQEDTTDKVSSLIGQDDKSSINALTNNNIEASGTPVLSPRRATVDNVDGGAVSHGTNDEIDEGDPLSKRRRIDVRGIEITPVVKPIREPRVVVQTVSEVDILDDGYRWRKYGQKVVRGNPNPRSYYKCTNAGCPVRKHVERASHDPKAVITTYEGKHNHDVPTTRNSSHDMAGATAVNGMSRIRSERDGSISLDLGVGMSYENRTKEQQQTLDNEPAQRQMHATTSNFKVVQAAPVSTCYGGINGGMNLYGSRENRVEDHSFQTPPLHHSSNPYPQSLGRILLGP